MNEQRRIIRASEGGWHGVEAEGYRPGDSIDTGVSRHTLIGGRKDDPADPGPGSELRYFAVGPGKASRLEKHEHEHYVIVREGNGYAIVGDGVSEVSPGDIVYVGPMEIHQFVNRGDTTFGFFCMVDACRDIPQMPSQGDLARLNASPAGAVAKPDAVPAPVRR
jgi:mannose-6-phosphate isomerase-like protein (cupin superfamily)